MKERARGVPVVRRFFWPPEMPRISSLPTRMSAHMSSPRICTHQRRQSHQHHNHGHRRIGPIFARVARNAMRAPRVVGVASKRTPRLLFLAYSPSRRSTSKTRRCRGCCRGRRGLAKRGAFRDGQSHKGLLRQGPSMRAQESIRAWFPFIFLFFLFQFPLKLFL